MVLGLVLVQVWLYLTLETELVARVYAPAFQHSAVTVAWTLFASMGLTELAHFIMPLLANEPYGYFPGMASVVILAPLAWWGMWRLFRGSSP